MAETAENPYRLLCMDGGGIYGYFTVLMLKRFAEKHKNFLSPGHMTAFAGTSAGALISMLLAKEKNPRDYLLSGELDKFFASDLLHGNQLDMVDASMSLLGLTTWCGGTDMQVLLKKELGDVSLGDLPNKVLIMTFDISGKTGGNEHVPDRERTWKTKVYHNFQCKGNDLDVPAWFVAYGAACPVTVRPVIDGITDGGIFAMSPTLSAVSQLLYIAKMKTATVDQYMTKVADMYALDQNVGIHNAAPVLLFGPEGSKQVMLPPESLVVRLTEQGERNEDDFIAYEEHLRYLKGILDAVHQADGLITEEDYQQAAASLGIGELERDDEAVLLQQLIDAQTAELALLEALRAVINDPLRKDVPFEADEGQSYDATDPCIMLRMEARTAHAHLFEELRAVQKDTHPVLKTLNSIQALSLGVGNQVPSFFRPDFNLGFSNFNMFPTNPAQNVWTPAALHLLYSPSTDHTDYESKQFLGDHYHRCSPKVIGFPTPPVVMSLYLARFKPFRKFILEGIKGAMGKAEKELNECEAWMEQCGWF